MCQGDDTVSYINDSLLCGTPKTNLVWQMQLKNEKNEKERMRIKHVFQTQKL